MFETLRSVFALLASLAIMLLGHGLMSTLVGVRATLMEFPTEVTGLIMSAYFAGLIIGTFWGQTVIRRVGHIRAFATFAAVLSVLPLGHAFVDYAIAWIALRVAAGICLAGLFMVVESWLNERATNENRGRVLGIYLISYYGALGTGQFLLNTGDPAGPVLFALCAALFSLSILPVTVSQAISPQLPQSTAYGFADLYRASPLGAVGSFGAGLVTGAFYGMGPIFGDAIGLSTAELSLYMGLTIYGGLVLQWPIGRMADRIDRRLVIIGIAAAVAATSAGIALTVGQAWLTLLAMSAAFGGFAFALYSVSVAHANDFVEPANRVKATAGLLLSYSVGATIGPLLASAVMGRMGPAGLYATTAVASILLVLFAIYRRFARLPHIGPLHRPYTPLPRSSPVALELAPTVTPDVTDTEEPAKAAG